MRIKSAYTKITENPAVQERWKEQYGRKPAEDDVQKMFGSFVPAQIEVLADYAALIPGTLEVIAELRKMGLKIGSTTGYTGDMMKVLIPKLQSRATSLIQPYARLENLQYAEETFTAGEAFLVQRIIGTSAGMLRICATLMRRCSG